jgi:hypothetical protein
MDKSIQEQYLADREAVLQQLERAARRERAEVVHQIFVAPLLRLLKPKTWKPARALQTQAA